MWWKAIAYENGISPLEFDRCRISDIKAIMRIKSAVAEKEKRNRKVQDLMSKVRFR